MYLFSLLGAMPGIKNPILVAKMLVQEQQKGLLPLGRVPPGNCFDCVFYVRQSDFCSLFKVRHMTGVLIMTYSRPLPLAGLWG